MPKFKKPKTKLILGDCLDEIPKLGENSIHLSLTDPPYGITGCNWDSIIPLDLMWERLLRVCKPRSAMVFTSNQPFTTKLIWSNQSMFRYCWYWNKSRKTGFPNANYMPLKNIEDVVVFSYGKPNPAAKVKTTYNPQGLIPFERKKTRARSENSVNNGVNDGSLCKTYIAKFTNYPTQLLEFSSVHKTVHPTEKPVSLMKYLIETYTSPDETVLDFSMGSGTTGVACKILDRNFIGIEKNEEYFEIAKDRIKNA